MKAENIDSEFQKDLDKDLLRVSSFARRVIESESSASLLANRLNLELPLRFEDLRRSVVANIESRIRDLGEELVNDLDAKTRQHYYKSNIEREITKNISCSFWPTWHPLVAPKVRTAATGCAIFGGVGTGLALSKAAGILPIKIPLLFGSPVATVVVCLAFTLTASAIAMRADKLAPVLSLERTMAQKHLDDYLEILRGEYVQAAQRAVNETMDELKEMTDSNLASSIP